MRHGYGGRRGYCEAALAEQTRLRERIATLERDVQDMLAQFARLLDL